MENYTLKKKLVTKLKNYEWYGCMSDDFRYHRKEQNDEREADAMIKQLGNSGKAIWNSYVTKHCSQYRTMELD